MLIISCLFENRHYDSNELLYHCGFDLRFLDNPAIPLLAIYPEKMKTVIQKDIYALTFIVAWSRYGSNISVVQQMNGKDVTHTHTHTHSSVLLNHKRE